MCLTDPSIVLQSQWTPLMIAVSAGRESLVEYLIDEAKADVNVVNSTGQCPLHYAASKNRLRVSLPIICNFIKMISYYWCICVH